MIPLFHNFIVLTIPKFQPVGSFDYYTTLIFQNLEYIYPLVYEPRNVWDLHVIWHSYRTITKILEFWNRNTAGKQVLLIVLNLMAMFRKIWAHIDKTKFAENCTFVNSKLRAHYISPNWSDDRIENFDLNILDMLHFHQAGLEYHR